MAHFQWNTSKSSIFQNEKCSNDISSFNLGNMKKCPTSNLFALIHWIQNFYFQERARTSARGARSLNQPKKWKMDFWKNTIFCLARNARASARAHIWCTPMHSPDPGDTFWLPDCYSSLKIGENRIGWNLVKNRIFVEKSWFFLKIFEIFENEPTSWKSIFTNFWARIAIK